MWKISNCDGKFDTHLHIARRQDLFHEASVVYDKLGGGLGDGGVKVLFVELLLRDCVWLLAPFDLLFHGPAEVIMPRVVDWDGSSQSLSGISK